MLAGCWDRASLFPGFWLSDGVSVKRPCVCGGAQRAAKFFYQSGGHDPFLKSARLSSKKRETIGRVLCAQAMRRAGGWCTV
ncbi:hypothetical protein AD949_12910 [Acetobacter orleanensis]|nr:hypothetical protein AD949_12910 [Acetobacter orleanensis]PCD80475.1 hypothetical protein CO710_01625 [Acetobacter orleanensis]